jgi:hypothetical protein
MANFKLGANAITAAYLGTQSVCVINDGANTVFDAACGAQFTVTHNVSGSPGGTTNGYTISTSPGTTFTGEPGDAYSFTTTVSLNSGYRWQGGTTPTISPSQPITGVVGSADSTVTTTISGGTVELIPVGVVTASVSVDTSSISAPSGAYSVSGSQTPQSGNSSYVDYSFSFTAQLNAGYNWTSGAPSGASASGRLYSSGTVTASFGSATAVRTLYTANQSLSSSLSGPSAGHNLTWDGISNYNASAGSKTPITGYYGELYSFSATTLTLNSPTYIATSALTLTGAGEQFFQFGSIQGGATNVVFSTTASGTVALAPSDVTMTLTVNTSGVSGIGNATVTGNQNQDYVSGSSPSQYQFATSIIPDSGYQYTGTNRDTGLVTYPASSGGVNFTFTGSVQLIINDTEIIGTAENSGSFTNKTAACNSTDNSQTVYFAGGSAGDPQPGARLYLGSGLTSEIASGWFYNDDQGSPFYYSGGISYYDSC